MGRIFRILCPLAVFVFTQPVFAGEISPGNLEQLRTQAENARLTCNNKIHFDTYAFENCIDKIAKSYKKDDLSRLAVDYAGFAIALSNMRTGMTGAEDTAAHFYQLYRPIQVKLQIDDMTLCSSIPTDCKVRVAMTNAFAKTIKTRSPSIKRPTADEHSH